MDELEQIQQQIAELQKKAEELASQKKQPVIDEIKAKLKAYGITAKDLVFSEKGSSTKPVSTVPIKYKKGEKTWTGVVDSRCGLVNMLSKVENWKIWPFKAI